MNLNLSERRGAARLMSAWDLYAEVQRFERDQGLRDNGRRRRKGDDVRNRTGAGNTAEWAVLEMCVRTRMVVLVMCRDLRLVCRRTRLQEKRHTTRRHEADRDVGTKQEDHQQQAGEYVSSPGIK